MRELLLIDSPWKSPEASWRWCRRDPLARPFQSCLDAVRGDAFQHAKNMHGQTSPARAKRSISEEYRSVAVMSERFQAAPTQPQRSSNHGRLDLEPLDLIGPLTEFLRDVDRVLPGRTSITQ